MFLQDLGAALQAADLVTLGTDAWYFLFPDTHNPATVGTIITPTGGLPGDRPFGLERPRVQILTRCLDGEAAYTKALAIRDFLDDQGPFRWGTTSVHHVKAVQPPFFIGLDQKQASRISCNYDFEIS